MLGTFHMAKNAMRCAGKYLSGSGIEDGLIELEIFGSKIVLQVFAGTHYYRSMFGLMAVEDACVELKMEAFWESHEESSYPVAINALEKLQCSLVNKNTKSAKKNLKDIAVCSEFNKLQEDINKFSEQCKKESEMCLYFENFVKNHWHCQETYKK